MDNFNFNDRIESIKNKYHRQLERKKLEEERIREIEQQQKIFIDEIQILKEELKYFKMQNVENIKELIIDTISTHSQ